MKLLNNIAYKVFEDNAGGLHLIVLQDINCNGNEKVIYAHSGYEITKGQLTDDIESLKNNADVTTWDGCSDDPKADYDLFNSQTDCYGCKVIAFCDYLSQPEITINNMGLSGLIEFNEDLNNAYA